MALPSRRWAAQELMLTIRPRRAGVMIMAAWAEQTKAALTPASIMLVQRRIGWRQ